MAIRAKALAFDFYGTLADLGSVNAACRHAVADADAFGAEWRRKQLEYTFLMSLMGRYRDFLQVSERALDFTLARFGLSLEASERRRLMQAWSEPATYPEVSGALAALGAKYTLAVLSNGSPRMLETGLKHAGLRSRFKFVLSADAAKIYKPSPRVYQLAVARMRLAKSQILFVSSNGWDVAGAKSFGFKVCHLKRWDAPAEQLGFKADLEAGDLAGLAEALGATSN